MVYFIATMEKTLVERLARLFKNYVWKLYGLLKSITLDRRVQFMAEIIKELIELLEIQTKLSMAYYLQTDGQMERVNQKLKQYLRVFIDYRQEQQLDWLRTAEFAYNNKIYSATKVSSFKTNYGRNPRIEFEERRKGKYKAAGRFMERMKRIQEKAKAALSKVQEKMKRFTDRKQSEEEKYKVGDLVLLSTKDLKWQIKGRRLEKLTEHFVGLYKVKGIILSNAIELKLPSSIKIHPVVNISQVRLYKPQVEEQKRTSPKPVIIKGEKEFEVERILNKRIVRGKEKFLVQQKGYTVEEDTQKSRENLENTKELVKEFKREYGKEVKEIRKQKEDNDEKVFSRELPGGFIAKVLWRWSNKEYERQRERRQKENWN